MPTTEKSPVGILSGWHFDRLAFCPVGILSYHPIQPHELVTHSKEKPFRIVLDGK